MSSREDMDEGSRIHQVGHPLMSPADLPTAGTGRIQHYESLVDPLGGDLPARTTTLGSFLPDQIAPLDSTTREKNIPAAAREDFHSDRGTYAESRRGAFSLFAKSNPVRLLQFPAITPAPACVPHQPCSSEHRRLHLSRPEGATIRCQQLPTLWIVHSRPVIDPRLDHRLRRPGRRS